MISILYKLYVLHTSKCRDNTRQQWYSLGRAKDSIIKCKSSIHSANKYATDCSYIEYKKTYVSQSITRTIRDSLKEIKDILE